MRTKVRCLALIAATVVLLSGTSIWAQGSGAVPTASARQLAVQAHGKAKAAKSLEELTEALQICGQAVKANPDEATRSYINRLASWTYNKRGELLVKLAEDTAERDTKRATEYEQAAIKDFGLAVRFDETSWKPRFNRGVSVAILGDYRQALADLDFVIQKNPQHKNAIFNRAEINLQLGEYARAVEDYGTVIRLDPRDAAAYSGRGIAFSALGEADKALLDLNAVVRFDSENAEAYVDRADLYASQGNWERAAGDYRVAVKLNNQLGRAYRNVAWMMATCPDEKFRDPSLAVRAARKAIELDGETYLGLDTLAAAQAASGKFQEATASQQKAVSLAPTEARDGMQARLTMYQGGTPFVESAQTQVRLATAEEPLPN